MLVFFLSILMANKFYSVLKDQWPATERGRNEEKVGSSWKTKRWGEKETGWGKFGSSLRK